jgi:CheY-like chemotaxis protein
MTWAGVHLRSTFLVAVRDPRTQSQLHGFFVSRGLQPLVTGAGSAVIHLLTECHDRGNGDSLIDLVAADADLPGLSGLDILRIVRGRQWPVQVVLTSATHDPVLRDQALRLGAAAYLETPISQAHLRRLFHRLVSAGGRQTAA